MAGQVPPLQRIVETDDDLETKLAGKGLKGFFHITVLEVEGWAGPCRSILPTFKRIRLDKDDEAALQFLVVPAEKSDLLETVKAHRGKSEPLFLLYRNGILKQKIEGANTPALSQYIVQFTPVSADTDDLAENPFNKQRAARLKAMQR